MDSLLLRKSDCFFPLITGSAEDSGGCLSLQNILDLKDSKTLDALIAIQKEIIRVRAQSQLFDDSLHHEPLLLAFFRFTEAMREVVSASRIMDSSHALLVQRKDGSSISLEASNFYLKPVKECLQHIQERYGRFELSPTQGDHARGSTERVIATTLWLLTKNHPLDYLMRLTVSRVPGSPDFTIKTADKTLSESVRKEILSEAEEVLIACCHPGRLGVFSAANVQFNNKSKKDYIRVSPTTKHDARHVNCNPGICLLERVADMQAAIRMPEKQASA